MQLLLPLLFVVSVLSPEPLRLPEPPPPPLPVFERINLEWETHSEGWDAVMRLPESHTAVTLQTTSDYVYRGMGSSVEQWRTLVATQFPAEQVDNALCVINSESGGNSNAANPRSSAKGLFQIMASVWTPYFGWEYEDLYVPELNVWAAARIWEKSGWQPWSPRTRRVCGL
jgi:hypothetical protein